MSKKSLGLSMKFAKEFKLTVDDVVDLTGFHKDSIRMWARNGKIEAMKRWQSWYFSEKSVMKFIESQVEHNRA